MTTAAGGGAGEGPYRRQERLERLFVGDVYLADLIGVEGFSKQVRIWDVRPELCASDEARELLLQDLNRAGRLSAYAVGQILDVWSTNEAIALTTEHLGGVSLRQALAEAAARGGPFPLEAAVAAVLEVTRALEEAHSPRSLAGGIVHGDLRPEHVTLGWEGTVKVTGFGFGRFLPLVSPDGAWSRWSGRCYQSPERRAGGAPSGAADLYSVGLMLLEAVTATEDVPFGEPEALLSRLRSGAAPDELGGVIARACRREPSERFGSASALSAGLQAVLLERRQTATTATLVREALELLSPVDEDEDETVRDQPRRLFRGAVRTNLTTPVHLERPQPEAPQLRFAGSPPPFFGRREELRRVAQALVDANRGKGRVIFVRGAPGMGRSRLLTEVAYRLASSEREMIWLQLAGSRAEHARPHAAVLRLLAACVGLRPEEPLERLVDREPRLRTLGLGADAPAAIRAALGRGDPPTEPGRLTGLLNDAAVRAVSSLCWERTTLLTWDDLQWADDASLGGLYEVLSRLGAMPAVVLLTAATDFELPWTLPPGAIELELEPMSDEDSEKLALREVGDGRWLQSVFLEALMEHTGGNPRLIIETIQLLKEQGRLELSDGQATLVLPDASLPRLEAVLRSRLAQLDGETRAMAVTAAVAGPGLNLEVIARATNLEADRVESLLENLATTQGVLRRTAAGFEFRRESIRRKVLATAKPSLLATMRRLIAQAILEGHEGTLGGLEDHAAELLSELEDHLEASEVLGERARRQEERGDLRGAVERYQRALGYARLAGSLSFDRELELCMAVGRTAVHSLDLDVGERALDDAVELARRLEDARAGAEARLLLCQVLARQGRIQEAIDRTREAMPLAESSGDSAIIAQVCGAIAESCQQWGEYGPDLPYIERALALTSEAGDLRPLGRYLQLAVMHAVGVGDHERTNELFERARAIATATDDPLLTCQLHKCEGLLLRFSGRYEAALKVDLEGIALAHASGLAELEMILLHNCGDNHLEQGRLLEALYYYNESLRLSQRARFDRLTEANQMFVGFLEANHLELDEGLERLQSAIDGAAVAGRLWNLAQGHRLLGRVLLERGEGERACHHLEEAVEHSRKTGVRFFIEEAERWFERARERFSS